MKTDKKGKYGYHKWNNDTYLNKIYGYYPEYFSRGYSHNSRRLRYRSWGLQEAGVRFRPRGGGGVLKNWHPHKHFYY